MPFVYHPYNIGSVPWTPPNGFIYNIVSFFFTIILLLFFGTITSIMATLKHCNKYKIHKSLYYQRYMFFGFILANLILFIFPIIKAPLLVMLIWIPYADLIVHGIYISAFVTLFAYIANLRLKDSICKK
jgi:hypothetical protein